MMEKIFSKPWVWGIIVLILWVANWIYANNAFCSPESRGQFGDMFGAVNALFSGLAFAGVVYTLIIQGKDVREQRFETTFFQLLTLHAENVKSMDFHRQDKPVTVGRDVFRRFYIQLKAKCKLHISGQTTIQNVTADAIKQNKKKPLTYSIPLETMMGYFEEVYKKRESDLSHYFRGLYHIFRYVDTARIDNKEQYIQILRAQLSSYEFIFLFYNGLTDRGRKFKLLLEKYQGLKNMDQGLIFDMSHKEAYASSTF